MSHQTVPPTPSRAHQPRPFPIIQTPAVWGGKELVCRIMAMLNTIAVKIAKSGTLFAVTRSGAFYANVRCLVLECWKLALARY